MRSNKLVFSAANVSGKLHNTENPNASLAMAEIKKVSKNTYTKIHKNLQVRSYVIITSKLVFRSVIVIEQECLACWTKCPISVGQGNFIKPSYTLIFCNRGRAIVTQKS